MAEIRKPSISDEKVEVINDTAGNHIDVIAEKKLLRKCDLYVLPPLFVLFLLAFLDSKQHDCLFERALTHPRDKHWKRKDPRSRSRP
jgi:hypothetical protein